MHCFSALSQLRCRRTVGPASLGGRRPSAGAGRRPPSARSPAATSSTARTTRTTRVRLGLLTQQARERVLPAIIPDCVLTRRFLARRRRDALRARVAATVAVVGLRAGRHQLAPGQRPLQEDHRGHRLPLRRHPGQADQLRRRIQVAPCHAMLWAISSSGNFSLSSQALGVWPDSGLPGPRLFRQRGLLAVAVCARVEAGAGPRGRRGRRRRRQQLVEDPRRESEG